jgi:hypothetical protein
MSPYNMKKVLLFIIFLSIIFPFSDSSYAQRTGQDRIECKPVYGHYWKSQRWGWYGAKRMVRTPDEAREILEKFFVRQGDIKIGKIREHPRFFEADIINRKGIMIDLIIIDKRSGRIRSIY